MVRLTPGHRVVLYSLRLVPVLIVAAGLFVATGGLFAQRSLPQPAAAHVEHYQDRLAMLEKQADRAGQYLQFLLVIAGLFVAVQGLFAFFSAASFEKQAGAGVARIQELETQFSKLLEEARSRFPTPGEIDQRLRDVVAGLSGYLLPIEPHFDKENPWDVPERLAPLREILAVEPSLAYLQFTAPQAPQDKMATLFRGLGRVYLLRYISKSQPGNREDFDRSAYYFNLALNRTSRPFLLYNDLGMLHSKASAREENLVDRARLASAARSYWERSVSEQPAQQRGYYNLAALAHYDAQYHQALHLLDTALSHPIWEVSPDAELHSAIRYNRACAISRLAERGDPVGLERIEEAKTELEGCLDAGYPFVLAGFRHDSAPGEDLAYVLGRYPDLQARVKSTLGLIG